MKIGFIGFGEAAYNMAEGLKEEGLEHIYAYDIMAADEVYGKTVHDRASSIGAVIKDSVQELIASVDIILAAVSAAYTFDVCKGAAPYLTADKIYVDVSASTPETEEKVCEEVERTGAKFVDVAMMGSLPQKRHKVEILACGSGASMFYDCMKPYHMNIEVLDGKAGMASGIKLIRSVFMKGLSALICETCQSARKIGIEKEVITSISGSLKETSFEKLIEQFIPAAAVHAKRRAVEMTGAIEVLDSYQLPHEMTDGTKAKLERIAGYHLNEKYAGKVPKDWREVLDIYNLYI